MLKIDNISFGYRRNKSIIRNFNMTLQPGTVCGLLGKNGAGKSTLLYLICGLLKPDSGSIDFKGHNPIKHEVAFLEDVMIVPEEFSLPNMKLADYVRVNAPFYPNFSQSDMNDYLYMFDLDPEAHLGKCSMGQKKKAIISFALACNTSLLILDEPTNGLDISAKRAFRKAVTKNMTDEKCIIISTHQVLNVEKILDHVCIIDNNGVLLNTSMFEVSKHLSFRVTNDRELIENALMSFDAPGGASIVERATPDNETDVNLEMLFEFVESNRDLVKQIFSDANAASPLF